MDSPNQQPKSFGDDDDPPVFIIRSGLVWACWLSGRAPVALGSVAQVRSAMNEFLYGDSLERPAGSPAAVPASSSVPSRPGEEEAASDQQEIDRSEPRHDLSISGRVHTGLGVREVTILDLSEHGCRFHDRFCGLRSGMPVSVRIGSVGPVRASVRWRRGEYVGIQFENPLYPSVLEHIREHFDMRR
jgi:hypothetical protein